MSKGKASGTPEWVTSFVEEVYPASAELALSMFDEKTVLTDAATVIREGRAKIEQLQRERDEAVRLLREYVVSDRTIGVSGLARQQRGYELIARIEEGQDE